MLHPAVVVLLLLTAPSALHLTSDDCLSCHGGSAATPICAEGSHPWHADYLTAERRGRAFLRSPYAPSGLGSTIAADLLVDGFVECTTCHLPHTDARDPENRYRLRVVPMTKLCRACHEPQ